MVSAHLHIPWFADKSVDSDGCCSCSSLTHISASLSPAADFFFFFTMKKVSILWDLFIVSNYSFPGCTLSAPEKISKCTMQLGYFVKSENRLFQQRYDILLFYPDTCVSIVHHTQPWMTKLFWLTVFNQLNHKAPVPLTHSPPQLFPSEGWYCQHFWAFLLFFNTATDDVVAGVWSSRDRTEPAVCQSRLAGARRFYWMQSDCSSAAGERHRFGCSSRSHGTDPTGAPSLPAGMEGVESGPLPPSTASLLRAPGSSGGTDKKI